VKARYYKDRFIALYIIVLFYIWILCLILLSHCSHYRDWCWTHKNNACNKFIFVNILCFLIVNNNQVHWNS